MPLGTEPLKTLRTRTGLGVFEGIACVLRQAKGNRQIGAREQQRENLVFHLGEGGEALEKEDGIRKERAILG